MSKYDNLNDLDDIEDEDFKSKKIKMETPKKSQKEEKVEDNIFVTNNPKTSTTYKEKLLQIYNELENINEEEIQKEIDELKGQILELLQMKESSDEKLRKFASQEIDKQLDIEKDLHYVKPTKQVIVKKVKQRVIFTPTNIIFGCLTIALMILSIFLILKL